MKTVMYSTALTLVLGLSGCATIKMQAPAGLQDSSLLPVTGHTAGLQMAFAKEKLGIGSFQVNAVDRDWGSKRSTSAGPWSREGEKHAYRYELHDGGRTLVGECLELLVTNSVAGFGKSKATFSCTCNEGEALASKVELTDGTGHAELSEGQVYDVSSIYQAEQGAQSSTALGYLFHGPNGEGAVDVSQHGRAWAPPGLEQPALANVACTYAGLLLYRPANR